MPNVKKLVAQSNHAAADLSVAAANIAGASVLDEAVLASSLVSTYIKMLIYGPNRVGKTTLSCDFPKPLLLLSFEPNPDTGGASSIRKIAGVKCMRVESTDKLFQIVAALKLKPPSKIPGMEKKPFVTVVVDTVTSLQDLVLREILGVTALPEQLGFGTVSSDQYRARAEQTKNVLRPLVDLQYHTVFLGKEKDHNPPKEEKVNERTGKISPDMRPRFLRGMQQESFVACELGGGTVGWLHDACDCIARLYFDREVLRETGDFNGQQITNETETGKFVRCLRTAYHPNYAAGVRSCDPDKVPEAIENPTYAKIAQVLGIK